jgi:hypothetical protein
MLDKMKINYKNTIVFSALVAMIMSFAGCKKYENKPPVFEEMETISPIQRKVIVVSIDGLAGTELKAIAPPAIEDLKKTGKYTFEVLNGEQANDVASWATMATGVSYSKHLIKKDDFLPSPKENSHDAPAVFRNVLDYILQYKSLQTAIVTPWPNLRNYLRLADFAPVVSTDLAVKDSVINILNKQTQIGALMVNFRDVEAAGDNGGFVASNANYKNAVLKADEYLGNIVTAIKARKSYSNEDWLIVVTTNHGGSNNNPLPGFLIASNKNIKSEEIRKRGFNSVLFNATSIGARVENDNGLYDSGATKDFTVQMQAKFNVNTFYCGFLSKGSIISGTTQTGWMWFQDDSNYWNTSFGGTLNGSGIGRQQCRGGVVFDGNWHTLTMTVKYVNATTRTVTTFTDGNQNTTINISGHKSLASIEKLTVGYKQFSGGTGLNFQGAEIQYFDVALDPAIIKANTDLKDITKHPNYANLIGYWQNNEGGEAILGNKALTGYNMNLYGPYTWNALGINVPSAVVPDADAAGRSIALSSGSVGATMLYWLNINILPEFGIDGNPFLNQFELEFIKK